MKHVEEVTLPDDWHWEEIGPHIAEFRTGIARGQKSRKDGYPHLRMNNISNELRLSLAESWRIPASDAEMKDYALRDGDILFNNTNSRDLVGKSCLFRRPSDETFLFSNHITRIRTKDSLSPHYFVFWLNHVWRRGFFREKCDVWVNQAAVRVEDLVFPTKLPLPATREDQDSVALILEARVAGLETARLAAQRQFEAATTLPLAMLRAFFEVAKTSRVWKPVQIADAIDSAIQVFDKRTFEKPEFTYIDITSVDKIEKRIASPKVIATKDAPSRATYFVRRDDILISTVRPNLNAVALVGAEHDGAICSSGFCVLRFKERFCPRYFFHHFLSPQFVGAVTALVQGAMYPAISDDDVRDFVVPAPTNLQEQASIADRLDSHFENVMRIRRAASRQLGALSALPAAVLREFFNFGNGVYA